MSAASLTYLAGPNRAPQYLEPTDARVGHVCIHTTEAYNHRQHYNHVACQPLQEHYGTVSWVYKPSSQHSTSQAPLRHE